MSTIDSTPEAIKKLAQKLADSNLCMAIKIAKLEAELAATKGALAKLDAYLKEKR